MKYYPPVHLGATGPVQFLTILCLILWAGATPALAQVRVVDIATGMDVPTCGTSGSPCQTIQYTLDNIAADGDTVYLNSGTYSLPTTVSLDSAVATIPPDMGLHFFGDSLGTGAVIDGNGERRGFHYDHTSTCPGTNGPDNGVADTRHFSFHNLRVQNCAYAATTCATTTRTRGGGIYLVNDPLDSMLVSVTHSVFANNLAHDSLGPNNHGRSAAGGAVYVFGRMNTTSSAGAFATVDINHCHFNQNGAVQFPNGGWGGAVSFILLSEGTIRNSAFCENFVEGLNADNGDLMNDRNAGGAVLIFDRNTAAPPRQYTIDACSFINNSATTPLGGTFVNQSEGGAVFLTRGDGQTSQSNAELTISNSNFVGNSIETGTEHFDNSSGSIDTLSIGNNLFTDSISFSLGNDTGFCTNDTFFLNAQFPGATYLWMDGSTNATYMVTLASPDTISVAIDLGGCLFTDTIIITNGQGFFSGLGPDLTVCGTDSIVLNPIINNLTVVWQDGSTDSIFIVDSTGQYWVQVTDSLGCVNSDTINITFQDTIIGGLGPDTSFCPPFSQLLDPNLSNVTFLWSDNSTDSTLNITNLGTYWFVATDTSSCVFTDTITVTELIVTFTDLGNDTALCGPINYLLDPALPNATYTWQDNSSNATLLVVEGGTYSFTATTVEGCIVSDTITISELSTTVALGNDTTICEPTLVPLVLTPQAGPGTFAWQDNSTGSTLNVNSAGTYTVVFTDLNGCTATDDLVVTAIPGALVVLGATQEICPGQTVVLSPDTVAGDSWMWSNGAITDSISVTATGVYTLTAQSICDPAVDSVAVVLGICPCDLLIPNVLTPNGDNKNDLWYPATDCIPVEYDLMIFNRWGAEVYKTNDITAGWDGTVRDQPAQEGTYFYMLSLRWRAGEGLQRYSGSLSLLK